LWKIYYLEEYQNSHLPHYEKERNWDSSIHTVVYDDNFSPCLPTVVDRFLRFHLENTIF
jgi:hypothetical protein